MELVKNASNPNEKWWKKNEKSIDEKPPNLMRQRRKSKDELNLLALGNMLKKSYRDSEYLCRKNLLTWWEN